MFSTKLAMIGVAALLLGAAPQLVQACSFDRHTGITTCPVSEGNPPRLTGQVVQSQPNIGIPGQYISRDGGRIVTVYLGGNGTGHQPFHWQKQ